MHARVLNPRPWVRADTRHRAPDWWHGLGGTYYLCGGGPP